MTPLLHRIYKSAHLNKAAALANPEEHEHLLRTLEDALCFECTDVMPLVGETLKALFQTRHEDETKEPILNHGGLAVVPHTTTWLEWHTEELGRVGILLCQEEQGDEISLGFMREGYYNVSSTCTIKFLPEDDCKLFVYQTASAGVVAENVAGYSGQVALALLIIINAPYGIEQQINPPHKKWAKEAAAHGVVMCSTRRVYLDKTKAPPPEYAGGIGQKGGHPKQFHFVRRHLRHFQNGTHTIVKPHWRGDPRLGIRKLPEYKVRP
jgi:hypothetical protein